MKKLALIAAASLSLTTAALACPNHDRTVKSETSETKTADADKKTDDKTTAKTDTAKKTDDKAKPAEKATEKKPEKVSQN